MTLYYSKTTGGFYNSVIHGNNIPNDAVEITRDQHTRLLDGQSSGKIITADKNGFPVLVDPPGPSENDIIRAQISALEVTVTDRRIREAVLGIDNGWLKDLNDQITKLRGQIKQ